MDDSEIKLKKSLIEATKVVKKKFRELHNNKLLIDERLEQRYNAITSSLKQIIKNTSTSEITPPEKVDEPWIDSHSDNQEYTDDNNDVDINENDNFYEKYVIDWDKYYDVLVSTDSDTQFGVRRIGKSMLIGKSVVKFHDAYFTVCKTKFPTSKGLLDLLFYKRPPLGYTDSDLKNYKTILLLTHAHRKYFENAEVMRQSRRSYKYKNIISKLFKRGSGIQTDFMTVNSTPIDYMYWDNPNELVERLRLLVSSTSAGHTGHNNEIISIIEELREANIIK